MATIRRLLLKAMDDLEPTQWPALFAELRHEITDDIAVPFRSARACWARGAPRRAILPPSAWRGLWAWRPLNCDIGRHLSRASAVLRQLVVEI
jgi:hypothetical protein